MANSTALRSDASSEGLPLTVNLPRRGWILAVALSLLIAASTAWVANSPVFRLRELRVTGAKHLSQAEVRRLVGLTSSSNVLWISGSDLARRLERNPWVASATVERHLPSGIVISIRERTPVARIAETGGRFLLVSGDGVTLGTRARVAGSVPVLQRATPVAGPGRDTAALGGLGSALRVVAALPPTVRAQVTTATERADGTVTLSLARGTLVEFGNATRVAEKGRVLRALLEWSAGHGVTPRTIDVEAPAVPAIVPA